MSFIDKLNESSVTFVREMASYGWDLTGPGYEAVSPLGEIQAFTNYSEANAWRLREVKRSAFGLAEIAPTFEMSQCFSWCPANCTVNHDYTRKGV